MLLPAFTYLFRRKSARKATIQLSSHLSLQSISKNVEYFSILRHGFDLFKEADGFCHLLWLLLQIQGYPKKLLFLRK